MARSNAPQQRLTLCTGCDQPLPVDVQAKSVSCRHCNGRVITESLKVNEYVAVRAFKVANHMRIAKRGIVYAKVRADDLQVDGVLQGEAVALQGIYLTRKARVSADLRACSLKVDIGAQLVGDVRIGPEHVPELENLRAAAEAQQSAG